MVFTLSNLSVPETTRVRHRTLLRTRPNQRFLDDCEKRLADAPYVMSFPATSAVAPHINEIRQESADATPFCARLFETPGVYPAYTDGVALAERVSRSVFSKALRLRWRS